jgi:taurine dioxygenase
MPNAETLTQRRAAETVHPAIRYEKVTGAVGAIVHGVDPADGHAGALASELVTGLHTHGVLFFHSRGPIPVGQFESFATSFGQLREQRADDQALASTAIDSLTSPAEQYRTNCWHTDGAWEATPPQAALLTPDVLPTVGGDTMWSSMYAAWDGLSSRYQRLLDGLEAIQSTAALLRHYTSDTDRSMIGPRDSSVPTFHVHPVVLRDPITNRQMLYVNSNWTERILGLKTSESEQLIQMLCEHVNSPDFHVRLRWQPNMVAIWEERVTQHRAIADYTERRRLIRLTIVGDRPSA